MGLFRRAKEKEKPEGVDVLVLQDALLVDRIDAFHSGEYERDKHPDTCQGCGNIDPGFRHCRRCGEEIKRKPKYGGYWFQEVVGEADYQEAFERLLTGADRGEDGGVREWVTVALLPEPSNEDGKNAVMVMAARGGPAQHVAYIPPDVAPAVREACAQAQAIHDRILACDGLIQGGSRLDDGGTAAYGIQLVLPLPQNMLNQMNAAAWH